MGKHELRVSDLTASLLGITKAPCNLLKYHNASIGTVFPTDVVSHLNCDVPSSCTQI